MFRFLEGVCDLVIFPIGANLWAIGVSSRDLVVLFTSVSGFNGVSLCWICGIFKFTGACFLVGGAIAKELPTP